MKIFKVIEKDTFSEIMNVPKTKLLKINYLSLNSSHFYNLCK